MQTSTGSKATSACDKNTGKKTTRKKTRPKVSICMIVKNDPLNLERCIDSLLPIIYHKNDLTGARECELIIVDTGSNDITPKIAQKHADKFYVKEFIPWNFSKARNFGIRHATGEKLLIFDADEVLPQESVYKLKTLLFTDDIKQPTIFLKLYNYQRADGSQYTEIMQPRIFRNDGKAIYKSARHNKPRTLTPFYFANELVIDHWGYMFQGREKLQNEKNERTVPWLEKAIKKDPKDLHAITHLVKHYQTMGRMDELKDLAERWIVLMDDVDFHDGWMAYLEVFVLLVNYYITKNDTLNIERVKLKAETYSKRLINMYFIMGEYYSEINREQTARAYMEHGLALASKPLKPHEMLLTQNTRIVLPKIMNWLACYYFRNGKFEKSGEMVSAGIQANDSRLPLRWDVFNEDRSRKRLITNEGIKLINKAYETTLEIQGKIDAA